MTTGAQVKVLRDGLLPLSCTAAHPDATAVAVTVIGAIYTVLDFWYPKAVLERYYEMRSERKGGGWKAMSFGEYVKHYMGLPPPLGMM